MSFPSVCRFLNSLSYIFCCVINFGVAFVLLLLERFSGMVSAPVNYIFLTVRSAYLLIFTWFYTNLTDKKLKKPNLLVCWRTRKRSLIIIVLIFTFLRRHLWVNFSCCFVLGFVIKFNRSVFLISYSSICLVVV